MKLVGKVGERKIYFYRGEEIERVIKLEIPETIIVYRRDYKRELGYLRTCFEDGDWEIDYEHKHFRYILAKEPLRNITIHLDLPILEKDEKTGEYKERIIEWLVRDEGFDFKVIIHLIEEIEIAEELIELKSSKFITKPKVKLEYYEKDKVLKIPFFKDEIRINVENENLEYIRNNKKVIKAFPLNKEVHFYGIKPEMRRLIVTSKGTRPANPTTK
jgi:hypothetical protein